MILPTPALREDVELADEQDDCDMRAGYQMTLMFEQYHRQKIVDEINAIFGIKSKDHSVPPSP